jgi:hypothetical protein
MTTSLINRNCGTPRISQDIIASCKGARAERTSYRKNWNVYSDGIHPVRALTRLFLYLLIGVKASLSHYPHDSVFAAISVANSITLYNHSLANALTGCMPSEYTFQFLETVVHLEYHKTLLRQARESGRNAQAIERTGMYILIVYIQ